MARIRTDIQALRGVAILIVLLYHARIGPFQSGFLGVDIFFVISGFLITNMVCKDIENGRFTFRDFYYRRTRRLFPAAFVVFTSVALIAPMLLTAPELAAFKKQLFGAMTLTGNIALWKQSGYFDGAAEFKPLLHVWSLAIEEQYYLCAPALLAFSRRRLWLRGALLIFALSLAACFLIAPYRPAAAFYLLPTRAWELTIGSLGALASLSATQNRWIERLFWPAVTLLIGLPLLPPWGVQPGFVALALCIATLVVILREHAVFTQRAWTPLSRLGDISYSLYLVHWPIFAFLRNVWIGPIPGEAIFAALGASVLLAILLYRFVETPFRQIETKHSRAALATAVCASVALAVTSFLPAPNDAHAAETDYATIRRINVGLNAACDFAGAFEPKPECRNAEAPNLLIWGDSFAMHLAPGLVDRAPKLSLAQATRSFCGPLLGVAPVARATAEPFLQQYNRDWAESCLAFNASVLSYLKRQPSIEYVVLASRFGQYLDGERMRILRAGDNEKIETAPSAQIAIDGMRRTIDAIRAAGKKVIVIGAPPSGGFDIGQCLERRLSGKPTFGRFANCDVPRSDYKRLSAAVDDVLERLRIEANVDIINFDATLCGPENCRTYIDQTFIYRDDGHFSYEGARLVARMTRLGERIFAGAR